MPQDDPHLSQEQAAAGDLRQRLTAAHTDGTPSDRAIAGFLLGNLFNGERITPSLGIGTALILLGLAAHQHDALAPMLRRRRQR